MSHPAKIKALIVDDEAPARHLLREYLQTHPDIEVVGECANGYEAIKSVAEQAPELLFLDVQMPKLNGFEVLELLGEVTLKVVFVTAFDQYALDAFDAHALDYLLKPFSPERLAEALHKVRQQTDTPTELSKPALLKDLAAKKEGFRQRILVREGSQIHVVPVRRLDYIEARDDTILLVGEGRKLRKQETLSRMVAELDPQLFVHIHRSYLLNIERLARLELYAKDSRVAILRDGTRLPVSRAGYGRLRKLL